jgi:1-acyl-sn-glycerol-3-phosphate acyltransferase
MLATGDRPRLQLRRLADGVGYARPDGVLRPPLHAQLRAAAKLALVLGALVSFALIGVLAGAVSRDRAAGRRRRLALVQRLCRVMHRVLNLRVTCANVSGREFTGADGLLFVPNHISYLDVIVMGAYLPAVFVTSREVEATPFLGHLTRAAGCVFVERRRKMPVLRDIDQLTGLLNEGVNVALFPEGTTSPGDGLLEFKRSLLESAIRSRCRVLPVCIRYERIDGQRYDQSNRDRVAWYGDMTFFPHLWQLMTTKSIDVRVTVLGAAVCRGDGSRKRLARDLQARIAERFRAD